MRTIIWIGLFVIGLAGVVMPSVYLYTASQLPQLESEYDLETHLRLSIEGERMSIRSGRFSAEERSHKFEKPDFTRLPHDLVAVYISQMGCPRFFTTPREDGPKWGWRMFVGLVGVELEGDGWCERYLSMQLAHALGIKGDLNVAVAAHKIHGFLQKDELIAYTFASMYFDRGVVGVNDAALELYRKDLSKFDLAELAEFTLALPIHGYYQDIKDCKNASITRVNRDHILNRLGNDALVPPDKVAEAIKRGVACLNVP